MDDATRARMEELKKDPLVQFCAAYSTGNSAAADELVRTGRLDTTDPQVTVCIFLLVLTKDGTSYDESSFEETRAIAERYKLDYSHLTAWYETRKAAHPSAPGVILCGAFLERCHVRR